MFGQQGVGHPSSLKKLDQLGATPTCIEYVKNDELVSANTLGQKVVVLQCDDVLKLNVFCSQGKKVYVLLGDGQLRLYHHSKKPEVIEGEEVNMRHQFNWHLKKTLRLSKRTASCIVFVEETDELWCGCRTEIVMVSNKTEMIERRIEIHQDCQALLQNKLPDVIKLVHMDSRVWALLDNSSEILEFDTELGILTHILKCDQINPHKMVVSKYFNDNSIQVQAQPISRKLSASSESGEDISSGEFDKWFDDQSSTLSVQGNGEKNSPPPVPERCASVSYPQNPPVSPPIPPRRPTKTRTLPPRSSPPAHSPPLPRSRHPIVNSVVGVGDSLWVGRSNGDILIINVKSSAQCQHGCVMAVMKSHCNKPHITHEVEKLVKVENLIFSVLKADSKYTELIAWEAYDASKIQKLEQIWARPKSTVFIRNSDNSDNVVDMGEI